MADQTQRLEIATVRAEVGSNIVYRFANDAANEGGIPTDSGSIQNLKQVILEIQSDAAEKISIATTIYQTPAAGLAATADGGIFLVQSADANTIYTVWQNQAGAAVNTGKTAMSSQAIEEALTASNEAAQAAEDAADIATSRTAGFLQPAAAPPVTRDDGLPLHEGDRYFNTEDQAEYLYKAGGWTANDSLAAIDDIRDQSDPEKGASDVGFDGASVADMLRKARPLADYQAVRSYNGSATVVRVTNAGIEGFFGLLPNGTYTDDGGVTIVSVVGKAWRRFFSGRVNVKWFAPVSDGATDCMAAFSAAASAASALASGLSGDVDIPAGEWFISGPVSPAANWYIDGAATIRGLPVVGSQTIPIHDTTYLTGRVFDFRAGVGSQVRIGAPEPWLSKYWRDISECISTLSVLSSSGRNAILAATRTSDRTDTGSLSYAISASVVNDDAVNVKGGWSAYLESYRAAGAGNTLGVEMDFLNLGDTKDLDPYNAFATGITANIWLSCGGGSTPLAPNANDISAHITSIKNSKGATRGWVVRDGSITGANKEVLATPYDHRWSWYSAAATVRSYLSGKDHFRTVTSDVSTDCPTDTSRKASASGGSPASGSTTYRHDMLSFNGTSYTQSGYEQLVQKTAFSGGFARFSLSWMARTSTGGNTELAINNLNDNEFGPTNDGVVNLGSQSARFNSTYSSQFRPGAGAVRWTSGSGTPEGSLTAPVGSLYTRTDGGAGSTLYIKESGTGNTGWVAK